MEQTVSLVCPLQSEWPLAGDVNSKEDADLWVEQALLRTLFP
jgi:hypothetical protein